jgi:hypothetical protein
MDTLSDLHQKVYGPCYQHQVIAGKETFHLSGNERRSHEARYDRPDGGKQCRNVNTTKLLSFEC